MGRMVKKDEAVAVVVDYQEKLMPAIYENEALEERVIRLLKGLKVHGVPMILTTQYARGLGNTVPGIENELEGVSAIDKNTFSCFLNDEFRDSLSALGRKSIILFGVESHICVQKTALDLLDKGYSVTIVEDCCSSRKKRDHDVAMRRMSSQGAIVTTCESVLFELMDGSKDPGFREISAIVK